jgi:hypothetical protein
MLRAYNHPDSYSRYQPIIGVSVQIFVDVGDAFLSVHEKCLVSRLHTYPVTKAQCVHPAGTFSQLQQQQIMSSIQFHIHTSKICVLSVYQQSSEVDVRGLGKLVSNEESATHENHQLDYS